jgi:hypothetical protein
MTITPNDNSGAANKAASDASAGTKADTQGWAAPLREAYETIYDAQKKKSGGS